MNLFTKLLSVTGALVAFAAPSDASAHPEWVHGRGWVERREPRHQQHWEHRPAYHHREPRWVPQHHPYYRR